MKMITARRKYTMDFIIRRAGAFKKLQTIGKRSVSDETVLKLKSLLGGRLMVRLQTLDLRIGVRVPASQPSDF